MQPQRIVVEGLETSQPAPARPAPRQAQEADGYAASPALALQQSLAAQLSEPHVERWPMAARLGFMVVSSALLWAGIISLGLQVAKGF